MDVAQLLDPLGFAPHVEIVVARLPERRAFGAPQLLRGDLLQHLQRDRQPPAFGFADQQVDVFGHDHISGDEESIPSPHPLQRLLEDCAGLWIE